MSRQLFATLVSGLLVGGLAIPPMEDGYAAPPTTERKSKSNGAEIPKRPPVGYALSCSIEGATPTSAGANITVRNTGGTAVPAGQTIQWKALPQVASGTYKLGSPLVPGASKMIAKFYDKSCTATVLP